MIANRRSIEDWLRDIVFWGERAIGYVDGLVYQQFLDDTRTQDAVVRCIENIGAASSRVLRIDPEFERRNPGTELSSAYRARNRLAHGYPDVDMAVVWTTATKSLPRLVRAVRSGLGTGESS